MGDAARTLERVAGLRPGCREKPRPGAANHAETRLRTRKKLAYKDFDTRLPATPQCRGAADRSAETDLHRRRTRNSRHKRLFSNDRAQGFHRWSQWPDQRARSRPDARPVFRLRVEPQLGRLLQP